MASIYTESKTWTDLVVYQADPVFAKQTLKSGVSVQADLNVGDVIDATGAMWASGATAAYVVCAPAYAGQSHVVVLGTGVIVNPEALNITDATAAGTAKTQITASGAIRIADENTIVNN